MIVLRSVVRIVLVALACVSGTLWLGWMSVPCIGFVYGMADRCARARGSIAAAGAAIGWIAILGAKQARGADLSAVADQIGRVMQLPAAVLVVVTIGFAAVLGGTAAVLGAAAGDALRGRAGRRANRSSISRD